MPFKGRIVTLWKRIKDRAGEFHRYKEPIELYYCTQFLLSLQDTKTGAWGDIKTQMGLEPDPFNTAWALYAFSKLRIPEIRKAESWLVSTIKTFLDEKFTPYIHRDYAAIASAVIALNERGQLREIYPLRSRIYGLFQKRFDDESGWFNNIVYSSIILIALKILGYDRHDRLVRRGLNWLKRERDRVDGLWGMDPKRGHYAIWCLRTWGEEDMACADAKKMYISISEIGFETLPREDFLYFLWMAKQSRICLQSERDYQRNVDEMHKILLQQVNTIHTTATSFLVEEKRRRIIKQSLTGEPEVASYFHGGQFNSSKDSYEWIKEIPMSISDFILYTIVVSKFKKDVPIHVSEEEFEQIEKRLETRKVFRFFAFILFIIEAFFLTNFLLQLSITLELLTLCLFLDFYLNSAITVAVILDKLNDVLFIDFMKGWRSSFLFFLISTILYVILWMLGKIPELPT
jgi:hypothetical protein